MEETSTEAAARKISTVCVTGGGGFLAWWLEKLLLSTARYAVRATARDRESRPSKQKPLGDGKNAHLVALEENAGERQRLQLLKAVLDYGSVASAVAGCQGVLSPALSHTPRPLQSSVNG
ncbi:hypothetical protein ACP4OV_027099 [Aristida adscensionis]